ncbi:diguanylate cyclase domain-containing protein [Azonexus sp.]|uniref:two-component system response regulator n=1 Tax=Azonexus sp. TaxID=1872668 RepID=UPI0035B19022
MPFRNLLLDDEKACVLAVDDTPAILQLLEMALGIDYEVVTAESGAQALEIFPQRRFDLVLLDLLMPGMNGFETLTELQKLPSFNGTPVIFLTAMDDLASECSALEMGADDYITKPFKPNLVRLRIANILHRVRLQRHLSLALAGADQGLWSWDLASDQVRVAAGWSEALGCANGEAAAEVAGWAALAHADCGAVIEQARAAYLAGERPAFEADVRLRTLKGAWKWFNIYGKSGNRQSLVGTYRNIDAKKAAELALRDSEERLRHVMDATGEGIWDWQVGSTTARHNAAWSRILGLDEAMHEHEIAGVAALIHPDDRAAYAAALAACLAQAPSFALEYRIRHASGNYLWVMDRGKVVERATDGAALRLVGAFQDISESKRLEEEYRRLALFDTLTGLPNRRLLVDRMEQAIVQNRRQASLGALMFIDMDRFKELNDSLGHDFGDLLLIEVGHRLQACVRRMDTVARLGGDEFIVMLPLLAAEEEIALRHAQAVGHKILVALGQPYRLGAQSYDSSPSIGLTLFSGSPEESVDAILKRADAAMYEAKHRGRNQLALAAPPPLT